MVGFLAVGWFGYWSRRPEAAAGAIALIETGDEIVVDLNKNELNCTQLKDETIRLEQTLWNDLVSENGGMHPSVETLILDYLIDMNSAVSAVYGAGMHPNRSLWFVIPKTQKSNFEPSNKFR